VSLHDKKLEEKLKTVTTSNELNKYDEIIRFRKVKPKSLKT
jgi:hypothetical protein